MSMLTEVLRQAITAGASDIHIKRDQPPLFRVEKKLAPGPFEPIAVEQIRAIVSEILPFHLRRDYDVRHEVDFSYKEDGVGRFRVSLYDGEGCPVMALRYVKDKIPALEDLNLPPVLETLVTQRTGIVILSGTTGCGKSTTLAALIEQINLRLRRRIVSGEFVAGQRLPTGAALAAEFGVSMSVLREAMSRLKHDGLILSIQGAGAFVARQDRPRAFRLDDQTIDAQGLARIFELRRGVEGEAARLAACRRTPAQLAAMHQALHDMTTALAHGEDGTEADTRFHQLVAEASGNPLFLEMFRFLSAHIATTIETARHHSFRQGTWQLAHQEHLRLLQAIEAGQPDAARHAIDTHIRDAAMRLGLPAS